MTQTNATKMTSSTSSTNPLAAVKNELAPKGQLRAGMNLGNTLFTGKDASGQLHGVSVDLMQELAKRLGVPLEMVVYEQPGQVADDSAKGLWDVAILAIEKTRAKTLTFSPAMTEIEAGYVVHQNSAIQRIDQVDALGVKIAAPVKAGYELYLTGALQHASLVRTANFGASLAVFNQQEVDVLAGLKPNLIDSMGKLPGAQLLEGNFMVINHGLATPLGHSAADEYLSHFVQDMIASGFIAHSVEKHHIIGLKAIKG
jgi:polar amino acid transport system substrate-binding protein